MTNNVRVFIALLRGPVQLNDVDAIEALMAEAAAELTADELAALEAYFE